MKSMRLISFFTFLLVLLPAAPVVAESGTCAAGDNCTAEDEPVDLDEKETKKDSVEETTPDKVEMKDSVEEVTPDEVKNKSDPVETLKEEEVEKEAVAVTDDVEEPAAVVEEKKEKPAVQAEPSEEVAAETVAETVKPAVTETDAKTAETPEKKVEEVAEDVATEIASEAVDETRSSCPSRAHLMRCVESRMDSNQNGKLEREELDLAVQNLPWLARSVLKILGSVDKMIKKCDVDGDGAIGMDYDMKHNEKTCLASCFKRRAFKGAFFPDCEL